MTDTSRIPFVETMLGISILEERLGPITAGAALLCNDGSFSLLFGRPIRLPEIVRCRRRDNVIEASAIEVVDLEREIGRAHV